MLVKLIELISPHWSFSIYNSGMSYHFAQKSSSIFAKFFAGPLIRYFPIHKNIDMHKLCGGAIYLFTFIHTLCHYANLAIANDTSLKLFARFGWSYWAYFSGAIILLCMFFICKFHLSAHSHGLICQLCNIFH